MNIQNLLRGLTMLVAVLSVNSVVAQEKLFQAALAKGRSSGQFYEARNDKGKGVSVDKMEKYAREHNYLIGDHKTQTVDKFGDKAEAVYSYEFLPANEYPAYVYEHLSSEGGGWPSYSAMLQKSKGSGSIYDMGKFCKLSDFYWTGDVQDGVLSGMGYGFWKSDDNTVYVLFRGAFQDGIPRGDCTYVESVCKDKSKEVKTETHKLTVGDLQGGYAPFTVPNGKYGFVAADGTMAIAPSYERVLKGFENGRAEVISEGKEIIIDTKGTFIDHTAKQKRLIAAEKAEQARKEQAERQAALEKKIAEEKAEVERKRLAEEAERRRIEKFRNAQPGDKVYYSEEFTHYSGFWIFSSSTSYRMAVVCFVEQNVNNGERLQIRVGSVKSTNSDYYSTPVIDGMEYHKGDVFWIRPLNDKRWQIE